MAYDEALADRIRETLQGVEFTERRMFGGLGFMVGGNMAVAAGSGGSLMVRVPPDDTARLLEEPGAEPMVMRGRAMSGWLLVAGDVLVDDAALQRWSDIGVDYAGSLPSK